MDEKDRMRASRGSFPEMLRGCAVLALLLLPIMLFQCGTQAMKGESSTGRSRDSTKERSTDTEMRVNRVLDIRQNPERHALQISTDRSGELWVDSTKFERNDMKILLSRHTCIVV